MHALGYVANPIASSMASGQSRMVPVVIPTLGHPVYVPFLQGVHEALEARGYDVLLDTTEYRQAAGRADALGYRSPAGPA